MSLTRRTALFRGHWGSDILLLQSSCARRGGNLTMMTSTVTSLLWYGTCCCGLLLEPSVVRDLLLWSPPRARRCSLGRRPRALTADPRASPLTADWTAREGGTARERAEQRAEASWASSRASRACILRGGQSRRSDVISALVTPKAQHTPPAQRSAKKNAPTGGPDTHDPVCA